ncbi:MAG TPA: FtsX-like permease family protein, partial [Thermomicrobiales bacterium]|nr:FtsX-like permease family protein [Thermomicrobiales bacterium]
MDELFGVPMWAITGVLAGLFALCLGALGWVAWRRPVIFKLGVRNVPRRKPQTVCIVLGLMLSTMLISAAFNGGDTMHHSATSHVYKLFGHVDELIVFSRGGTASAGDALTGTIDSEILTLVDAAAAGNPEIDGLLPALDVVVPVLNTSRDLSEGQVLLSGIDSGRIAPFGGLRGTDGSTIDVSEIRPGEVVVNERAAEALGAVAGDELTIYYDNEPVSLTVAAVAEESMVSGARYPGYLEESPLSGMVMPLDGLQDLTGLQGQLSLIAVSNRGGVIEGAAATDGVVATLEAALVGQTAGIAPIKQDGLLEARGMAQGITAMLLVLSLFSVAAGVLLIILIFTMLAAERRSEMGMARALGAQRRQLIEQFMAEGAAYALLAGLIGAVLGVALSAGILRVVMSMWGGGVDIDQRFEPRSVVIAYNLGVVLAFLMMIAASWKISRLNVVAAIRDIPDVTIRKRKKSSLVW